jgi:CheY-like chemotaxis protein
MRKFEVTTAVSAADALAALATHAFDLVVTDMRMETDFAGYEVVRGASGAAQHPVVIILSAYPIPPNEWRAAGADAAFMKGGGVMRMLDDIERTLQSRMSAKSA